MARPRSANELSVACLWSAQHPLAACARSAHDLFAAGQPTACEWFCQWSAHAPPGLHACGQVPVNQRVVAFIGQTYWTHLCAGHWTDHGFGRPMSRPFDRQQARPLDRPNVGRSVGRLVSMADHWARSCVANKQANMSTRLSSDRRDGQIPRQTEWQTVDDRWTDQWTDRVIGELLGRPQGRQFVTPLGRALADCLGSHQN